MNIRDRIGKRGETLFAAIIGRWCEGRPWFEGIFLGDKHPTEDFLVKLIGPTSRAIFFVQVKATRSNYTGIGAKRKLNVSVARKDVVGLARAGNPAYVVGVDIDSEQAFIKAIGPGMDKGFRGISTANELRCDNLLKLWRELDAYANGPAGPGFRSIFS